MRLGILLVLRQEAAIDHDHCATGELGRREHPIADALDVGPHARASCIDQGFAPGRDRRRERDAPEFIALGTELRPALRRWQWHRLRAGALGKRVDQAFLPGLALKLPSAKPDQHDKHCKRKEAWPKEAR